MPPKSDVVPQAVVTLKRGLTSTDPRLPSPGTAITREYKGQKLEVRVQPDGFEFDGERFKTLAKNLNATVIIQHDRRDIDRLPLFPAAAR